MNGKRFTGRRRRRGRGQRGGDWEVSLLPSNAPVWYLAQSLTVNAVTTYDLAAILPTAGSVYGQVPPLGRMLIREIDFQIDFLGIQNAVPADAAGQATVWMGLYMGEFDRASSAFSSQDPSSANDLCRENWIDHKSFSEWFPLRSGLTAFASVRRRLTLKGPVSVAEGMALRASIVYGGVANSTLLSVVSARAHILRVV